MKRQILCMLAIAVAILSCQKSDSSAPKKNEAFFPSEQDVADKVNQLKGLENTPIKVSDISSVSYVHSSDESFAFVFYQTTEGPQNLVIARRFSKDGNLLRETSSTCNGTACNCQVQAVIDNQGNVTIGCNCASCVLVSSR